MKGNNFNETQNERLAIRCSEELKTFAKAKAKELNLRGGVSELIIRLLVAESTSKKGIAEKHSTKLATQEAALS